MWRRESKKTTLTQMQKREKVSSLFSLHIILFFFVFFFLFFCLRRRRCQKESAWNKRVKTGGQKWEPKVRGQNKNLKVSSFFSLHFYSSLWFLFFSFAWKEKDVMKKHLKQKGRSGSQKWEGLAEAWKKIPSLFCIFFLWTRVCKVVGEEGSRKSHNILPGMWESVREWTFTPQGSSTLGVEVPMDSQIFKGRL